MLTRPASADSTLPPIPRALLVAALAFGFCLLARLVSHGDAVRLLFWPATGVAFAFGWRHGLAWTAPAAVGAFAYGALAYRDAGLAAATRESFFVANLYTVRGEILEAQAATLDGAAAPADATRARELKRQAIVAYDKSIAINEALQQRLMGHP